MSLPLPEVHMDPSPNNSISSINNQNANTLPTTIDSTPTNSTNHSNVTTNTSNDGLKETSQSFPENSVAGCNQFGVLVHHQDKCNYILSQYCLPVSTSNNPIPKLCKFGDRECVVMKSQLLSTGTKIEQLSETTFSPSDQVFSKYGYNVCDTRLIKCFSPDCIDKKSNRDKVFHHSCFMHSLKKKENKDMKVLEINSVDDIILGLVRSDEDCTPLVKKLVSSEHKLIVPVCSKSCYNSVVRYKVKTEAAIKKRNKNMGTDMLPTNNNWDSDGIEGVCVSSSRVLVNWLTTEENATAYFGGSNKDGRTSSTRKETYHNIISKLIQKENGKNKNSKTIFIQL